MKRVSVFSVCCAAIVAAVLCLPAFGAEYSIDPVHSSALFKVNHLGASNVWGAIPGVTGRITFDASKPEASSVEITIKPERLTTFNQSRDNHLKSPDFFNAKQFPVITFKSRSWKKTGENSFMVTGDFTLRGVTKELSVAVTHVGMGKNRQGKELAGFETQFTIDRTDFGMTYGVAKSGGLGKEVTIIISVESVKQ